MSALSDALTVTNVPPGWDTMREIVSFGDFMVDREPICGTSRQTDIISIETFQTNLSIESFLKHFHKMSFCGGPLGGGEGDLVV